MIDAYSLQPVCESAAQWHGYYSDTLMTGEELGDKWQPLIVCCQAAQTGGPHSFVLTSLRIRRSSCQQGLIWLFNTHFQGPAEAFF